MTFLALTIHPAVCALVRLRSCVQHGILVTAGERSFVKEGERKWSLKMREMKK